MAFGGLRGVVNGAALESAIARPYNGHYPKVWSKAAALIESLVGNHPFVDGNKRTALIVAHLFVLRSGYRLPLETAPPDFENMVLAVAAGRMRFPQIEAWFRTRLVKKRSPRGLRA